MNIYCFCAVLILSFLPMFSIIDCGEKSIETAQGEYVALGWLVWILAFGPFFLAAVPIQGSPTVHKWLTDLGPNRSILARCGLIVAALLQRKGYPTLERDLQIEYFVAAQILIAVLAGVFISVEDIRLKCDYEAHSSTRHVIFILAAFAPFLYQDPLPESSIQTCIFFLALYYSKLNNAQSRLSLLLVAASNLVVMVLTYHFTHGPRSDDPNEGLLYVSIACNFSIAILLVEIQLIYTRNVIVVGASTMGEGENGGRRRRVLV